MLQQYVDEDALMYNETTFQEAQHSYLQEQEKENASLEIKFKYAMELIHAKSRDNKLRGIGLLKDLIDDGFSPAACLLNIAITYYLLQEYGESRTFCERLLRRDPSHEKALILHERLREIVSNDGSVGLGLLAGAAVMTGVLIKYVLKQRSNNK